MKEINPYLNFDGNCRQAMAFYRECLDADLQLSPFPDAQGQPVPGPDAKVMHSQLSRNGLAILMASDCQPGDTPRVGNNISIAIQCESLEEIERLFAALGQNGKVILPLGDMFWGARFGMLTDQFGIQWLLNCALNQPKA
jgi:PhnB protein